MIKSYSQATAALSMSAGAALAGPYVNVETNAGWTGADYTVPRQISIWATKVLWAKMVPGTFRVVPAWSVLTVARPTPFLLVRQVWVSL